MARIVPLLSRAGRGLLAITLTLLIVGAVGLAATRAQGHKLLSVQTASMLPAIRPGDALVITAVPSNQLRVGDVISYRSPRDPAVVISHRLLSIDRRSGKLVTAGDALHSPDPAFPAYMVIGRATAIAPRLGLVLDTLRRPVGLALAIYLPAALTVTAEARRLAAVYARPFYSARL